MLYASDRLKNNESVVLKAVRQNGLTLEYASSRLKDNYYVVLEAAKENERSLMFASKRLQAMVIKNYNRLSILRYNNRT